LEWFLLSARWTPFVEKQEVQMSFNNPHHPDEGWEEYDEQERGAMTEQQAVLAEEPTANDDRDRLEDALLA
jgi:hypothetical protein